jgi:ABC-type Zn uptake system ZnuABC Zn-binding protein ZnuA
MRARSVGVVIVETYNSRKNAEFVADKAHARAVVLAQEVKAIDGVDSYEAMFEYNVRALREAFDAVATASDSKSASGG